MPSITNWDDVPVIIDVRYAMALLGLSRTTVLKLLQNGDIPAVKFRRQWRIDKENLRKFIKGVGADEHRNIRFSETEKSGELNPKGIS